MSAKHLPQTAADKVFFKPVTANYQPHPIPRLQNNPLISALPRFPTKRSELKTALNSLPDFSPEQRLAPRVIRKMQLAQLSRFFVGLPRVCELSEYFYAVMCEGYVGREPNTPAANTILQQLYDCQQLGQYCSLGRVENTAQFCSALTGMPGTGKSFTLTTIAQMYPPIIHHPDYDIWQIPTLYIEMAYNGASLATLAQAIITEIAKRYPPGDYERLYLRSRANAEQQLLAAFALIHIHRVGIVIVDESQNRDYEFEDIAENPRRKKKAVRQSPLATLLITASNRLQVPLLLAGTSELEQVLGSRLSKTRRLAGMPHWGPLSLESSGKSPSEYDIFLGLLWQYQWLQQPVELTPRMRNIFHYYTFGVPDFIVKLFHALQWETLQNDEETFTEETIHDVATSRLRAITKVTRAMRTRGKADLAALSLISDVAPEFGLTPTSISVEETELQAPAGPVDPADDPVEVPMARITRKVRSGPPVDIPPETPADWRSLA